MLFSLLLLVLLAPPLAQAETKVITAEAIYTMGDGETPTFAEAMVLQKAKQTALEQAGTYVESYTKVRNLDLTTEEIQTIAGGVVQVEVLQKKRSAMGEGFQFFVKIKAAVATDKMEELAQRIKGKNVAAEYKQLQQDYARLSKELDTLKQSVTKNTPGPQREAALEQIREYEKAFGSVQKNESAFFQRLVAGEALVGAALDKQALVDQLVHMIIKEGQLITVGEVKAHAIGSEPGQIMLIVPVTLSISATLIPAISKLVEKLNGRLERDVRVTQSSSGSSREMLRVGSKKSRLAIGTLIRLADDYPTAAYFQTRIRALSLELRFTGSTGQAAVCVQNLGHDLDPIPLSYNPLFPIIKISFSERDQKQAYVDYIDELVVPPCLVRKYKNPEGIIVEECWPDYEKRRQSYIDSNYGNDAGAGFVVALNQPTLFGIEVRLPKEVARDMKQIDARIVEAGKETAQSKGTQVYCGIAP